MTGIGSHTIDKDSITIHLSMVLYWGLLDLGIFYGSADFQGFSIWGFSIQGFSYTIAESNLVVYNFNESKTPVRLLGVCISDNLDTIDCDCTLMDNLMNAVQKCQNCIYWAKIIVFYAILITFETICHY